MTAYNQITQVQLHGIVSYCPSTGVFVWKKRRTKHHLIGKPAGSLSNGYLYLWIEGHSYPAHRLAWLYVHGRWPLAQVDHKNRNRADNRIGNLREATHGQNQVNKAPMARSGFTGVYPSKKSTDHPWRAAISRRGGGMKHIGQFATREEAAEAFRREAALHYGEFAR
jgi:hypothetical protein